MCQELFYWKRAKRVHTFPVHSCSSILLFLAKAVRAYITDALGLIYLSRCVNIMKVLVLRSASTFFYFLPTCHSKYALMFATVMLWMKCSTLSAGRVKKFIRVFAWQKLLPFHHHHLCKLNKFKRTKHTRTFAAMIPLNYWQQEVKCL